MGGQVNSDYPIDNEQNCFKNCLAKTENSINKAGSFCARKLSCLKKASPTLLKIAIAVASVVFLWYATIPTLAGILIGVIFKDKVKAIVERVRNAIKDIPLIGKVVISIAAVAVSCAIPWASGFAFGSYGGSELHRLTMRPKHKSLQEESLNRRSVNQQSEQEAREIFNTFGIRTKEFLVKH